MKILFIVFGILLFAIATAVLYAWGLQKSLNQRAKLQEILYQRCANKVMDYLKKNNEISIDEVKQVIKNVVASEFYSKNKAKITDVKAYSGYLCDKMIQDKLLFKTENQSYRKA